MVNAGGKKQYGMAARAGKRRSQKKQRRRAGETRVLRVK